MPINHRYIEDFIGRVQNSLPGGLGGAEEFRESVRDNIKEALAGLLAKMDLVTREEFEVQAELLDRAYTRLEKLESLLSESGHTLPESNDS